MRRSKGILQMPPQQGTPDNPIIYVCEKCRKSFRISLRKTITVNTIGVEK